MLADLNSFQLILLIVAALLGPGLLVVGSRVVNPLYILASVILVLAPFSMAPDLGVVGVLIKWLRGYCLVLLVVIGLFKYQQGAIRTASQLWLAFSAAYILSGLWSVVPPIALAYKAQFGLVVTAGILLATGTRNRQELIQGLRCVAIMSGIVGLSLLAYFVLYPESSLVWGRPQVFGVTGTRVASNFAPLAIVCIYLALNDRSLLWKCIAAASSAVLVAMILVTLSRGSSAAVILGFLILMALRGRGRFQGALVAGFVVVIAVSVFDMFGGQLTSERLVSTSNTRAEVWGHTVDLIVERPMIGYGWLPTIAGTPYNAHNLYLQATLEMGLLGLAFLCVSLVVLSLQVMQTFRSMRRHLQFSCVVSLPVCLICIAFFNGLSESAVLAASPYTFFLAFSFGLIDGLPRMLRFEKQRVMQFALQAGLNDYPTPNSGVGHSAPI